MGEIWKGLVAVLQNGHDRQTRNAASFELANQIVEDMESSDQSEMSILSPSSAMQPRSTNRIPDAEQQSESRTGLSAELHRAIHQTLGYVVSCLDEEEFRRILDGLLDAVVRCNSDTVVPFLMTSLMPDLNTTCRKSTIN